MAEKSKIHPDVPLILYSDNMNITTNKNGVVLNFMQKTGNTKRVISRIGMSREHAKEFVEKLGRLILMTDFLPENKSLKAKSEN